VSIKVSALVSTFNSEKFLSGRLQNLLDQTLSDSLEIIVINSGSAQGEREIVSEFQRRFDNIHYIETERECLYQSWNRGLSVATGEYISNANTDDRLFSNAYEVLAGALDRNQHAAVAYANEYFTELESDIIQFDQTVYSQWKLVELPAYSHKELLLNCLCGAQPMWRRCLHNSHGMFDSSFVAAGDYEFWLRVAEDFPFEHVSEPLGVVFENPHGIVNSDLPLTMEEYKRIRLKYFDGRGGASLTKPVECQAK